MKGDTNLFKLEFLSFIKILKNKGQRLRVRFVKTFSIFIKMEKSAKTINDLPREILEMIFQYLPLKDVFESCANTCLEWRIISTQRFMRHHFNYLSEIYHFRFDWILKNEEWNQDCKDIDFIMNLYERLKHYPCK